MDGFVLVKSDETADFARLPQAHKCLLNRKKMLVDTHGQAGF